MTKLEEKIRYSGLLLIYKELLTEKQISVLEDYYNYDLSLTEIGNNHDVSKNAVHDLIKRTSKILDDYENCLKCFEKEKLLSNLYENIDDLTIEEIKNTLKKVI